MVVTSKQRSASVGNANDLTFEDTQIGGSDLGASIEGGAKTATSIGLGVGVKAVDKAIAKGSLESLGSLEDLKSDKALPKITQ